jgi:DNA-binding NtrC family response regulator
MQIKLPPLRKRGTDVLILGDYFLKQFSKQYQKKIAAVSQPVAEKLMDYDWPGNIRELKNVIERAVVLTQHQKIVISDLPTELKSFVKNSTFSAEVYENELASLKVIERRYIQHVISKVEGNRSKAARILGIDRKTLYRKLDF